ncbi:ribosome biogenesis protein SSF1/2, partial [Paragonimus westermani]
ALSTVAKPNRFFVVIDPSDGRLVQDTTPDGYSVRRPNPAEWTGNDFPSLSATISTVSSSLQRPASTAVEEHMQVRKGAEPSKSTGKAVTSSSSMASVTSRGRCYQMTADDFPTLPGSSSYASIPHWRKNVRPVPPPKPSSIGACPKVTTVSDFPALFGQSSRSLSVASALPSYAKKTKSMKNKTGGSPFTPLISKASGTSMRSQSGRHENLTATYNCSEILDVQDVVPDEICQPNNAHIQLADRLPNSSRNRLSHSQTLPDNIAEDFPPLPIAHTNASRGSDNQALSNGVLKIGGSSSAKRTPSKKAVQNQNWPPPPSGLTDTECILFANARYVPVNDAEVRNRELIQTIETELFDLGGKTAFARFADVSHRYSHGQLTATSYLEALLGLLTPRTSDATRGKQSDSAVTPLWIAPMLALLPNIGLQRALLRAMQGQGAPRLPPEFQSNKPSRRSREPILPAPVWSKNVLSLLQCCRLCGQASVSVFLSLVIHLPLFSKDDSLLFFLLSLFVHANVKILLRKRSDSLFSTKLFLILEMTGRKRPKAIRKARALAVARQERSYSTDPHSFVFARTGVGNFVKQLSLDLRSIFEPFTATRLKATRHNVLRDFVAVSGPLHVTHLLYLTHPHAEKRHEKRLRQSLKKLARTTDAKFPHKDAPKQIEQTIHVPYNPMGGGVYLHLIRLPHGPSLTFSVAEYSFQSDVLTLVRRIFDSHQFTTPPLLVMTGFGISNSTAETPKQPPSPHLRLIVDMFQNMLPPLNVHKLKLNTVRRVLLISREIDLSVDQDANNLNDIIYLRHYHIRTENRAVSRALRRLSLGGVPLKKRKIETGLGPGGSGKSSGVPNLAKYTCIEDFLTKAGMLSDSGLSDALSDLEEADLPQSFREGSSCAKSRKRKLVPIHGLSHLGVAKKAAVRLTEIGPRLTLKLIKIEEGLNTGCVLYHRWQTRTLAEVADQSERLRQRAALRANRRAEHEARRSANETARETHRTLCMSRAKQLPKDSSYEDQDRMNKASHKADPVKPHFTNSSNVTPLKFKTKTCIKKLKKGE